MTEGAPGALMPRPDASPDSPAARLMHASAGYEIVSTPGWAWIYTRRSLGPAIAALVSGGVAGIIGVNALLFVALALSGQPLGPWPVLAAELGVLALAGGICRGAYKLRKRRLSTPREQLSPVIQVDRSYAMVLDGDGQPLAPAAQVQARKTMRIDSSAPSLMIVLPDGRKLEVARGSLFGGGLEPAKAALRELGFAVR